jgi:CheY-like chemotaxis protein
LFNLRDEFRKLIKSYKVQADKNNNQLHLFIDADVPTLIKTDPLRLGQIISNLLNNAIKFTKDGTIGLTVKKESVENNLVKLKFMVSDTGIGIEKKENVNLFAEYEQGDTSVTRTYGGSGLGLSISSRLCALMGGKLDFESVPGKETVFGFTLSFEFEKDELNVNKKPLKFLIVEDNLLNQKVVSAILKKHGHTFDVAVNGLVAVEKIKKSDYDIVLMDIQMPEMDGYDATKHIRNIEKQNDTQKKSLIVALTANATTEDRTKCLNLGMDEYLVKPFNFENLEPILSNLKK